MRRLSTKKKEEKSLTLKNVDDNTLVHLTLVSPPPSDRPSVRAACEPVKKPQKILGNNKLTTETAEINELIKKAEGGKNMGTLRERRQSKELPSKIVLEPETKDPETNEVNALLKQVNEAKVTGRDTGAVLRERRRSKEVLTSQLPKQQSIETDTPGDRALALSARSVAGNDGGDSILKANQKEKADVVAVDPEREVRIRFKEDAAAVTNGTSAPTDNETSSEEGDDARNNTDPLAKLFNPVSANANLTGAAARGLQAAALDRVKQAAQVTGGVYLTADEWEAIRNQMKLLAAQNKRLMDAARKTPGTMPIDVVNDSEPREKQRRWSWSNEGSNHSQNEWTKQQDAERSQNPRSPSLRRQASNSLSKVIGMVSPVSRRPPTKMVDLITAPSA